MPLDQATIQRLTALAENPAQGTEQITKRRLTKIQTQYPQLKSGKYIELLENKKFCASRGCRTSTWIAVGELRIPYCMTHTIYELNRLLEQAVSNNGNGNSTSKHDGPPKDPSNHTNY